MKASLKFIVLAGLCISSCGPFGDYELDIYMHNNSGYTLLTDGTYDYPDTTIKEKMYFEEVLPHSFGRATFTTRRWNRTIVNEKMCLFIFYKDVVNSVPWETIRKDYMVLQRYDLSIDELEKLNWTVYYPPTEEMKDIDMFPPYGEGSNRYD